LPLPLLGSGIADLPDGVRESILLCCAGAEALAVVLHGLVGSFQWAGAGRFDLRILARRVFGGARRL